MDVSRASTVRSASALSNERFVVAQECNIAQATNGSLLLIARNCHNNNLETCRMRRRLAADAAPEPEEGGGAPGGSHRFAVSMSHDGGEHWGPITQQPQLVTPVRRHTHVLCWFRLRRCRALRNQPTGAWLQICQASIISYKGPKDSAPALYFSHPYSTTARENGTILASDGAPTALPAQPQALFGSPSARV